MYFIGLDLGQRRDFSASAVIQRQERMAVWSPNPACSSGLDRKSRSVSTCAFVPKEGELQLAQGFSPAFCQRPGYGRAETQRGLKTRLPTEANS